LNLPLRLRVFHAFTGSDLLLGYSDVFEKLGSFHQSLVLSDVQKHGGAAAALRENQWATGLSHLLDEGSRVGAELRKRTDILAEANGHTHLG
jgi:hypothetical protein